MRVLNRELLAVHHFSRRRSFFVLETSFHSLFWVGNYHFEVSRNLVYTHIFCGFLIRLCRLQLNEREIVHGNEHSEKLEPLLSLLMIQRINDLLCATFFSWTTRDQNHHRNEYDFEFNDKMYFDKQNLFIDEEVSSLAMQRRINSEKVKERTSSSFFAQRIRREKTSYQWRETSSEYFIPHFVVMEVCFHSNSLFTHKKKKMLRMCNS